MADFTALRGIVCPVVSPCAANDGVDYGRLQENLARLLHAPITGFYVCGGTGDGSRLTFAERCRTAELTIAQTRVHVAGVDRRFEFPDVDFSLDELEFGHG